MKMKITKALLLGTLPVALCCTIARGQSTIYANTFTGQPATAIEGVAPGTASSYAGGSSSALWNDDSAGQNTFLQNGTVASVPNNQASALLPFIPQSGYIYTLLATLSFPSGSGNWWGIGFTENDPVETTGDGGRLGDSQVGGQPWMLIRTTGANQGFPGLGASTLTLVSGALAAGNNSMSIVLNTTGAEWTDSFYVNNVLDGTYTYTSANPTISAVGFGSNGSVNGTIDTFSLTASPTPEPTSVAMVGLGLGALALIRRKRA
jgi:hypothetical protein